MSIVNIRLWPDRAIVVTDTSISAGGVQLRASKIASYPHGPLVLAGRGSMLVLAAIAPLPNAPADIDATAIELRARFGGVLQNLRAAYRGADLAAEVYLVGWCRKRSRMRGWAAYTSTLEVNEIQDSALCAPFDESMSGMPLETEDDFVRLARAQYRLHQHHPAVEARQACGGELIMTEITPRGIASAIIANLAEDVPLAASNQAERLLGRLGGFTIGGR